MMFKIRKNIDKLQFWDVLFFFYRSHWLQTELSECWDYRYPLPHLLSSSQLFFCVYDQHNSVEARRPLGIFLYGSDLLLWGRISNLGRRVEYSDPSAPSSHAGLQVLVTLVFLWYLRVISPHDCTARTLTCWSISLLLQLLKCNKNYFLYISHNCQYLRTPPP